MSKRIIANYPASSWAVSPFGKTDIFSSGNLTLYKLSWYESFKRNIVLLREFFSNLSTNAVSRVSELQRKPDGVYSLTVSADLKPLYEFWKDSLHFECLECEALQDICSCLINTNKSCFSKHVTPLECSQCKKEIIGAHFRHISFFDTINERITLEFNQASAYLFLQFSCEEVVSDKTVYIDFISTLLWHKDRMSAGLPFLQKIVIKKSTTNTLSKYIFVSGVLQPICEGHG